jgi:hypothetical protein
MFGGHCRESRQPRLRVWARRPLHVVHLGISESPAWVGALVGQRRLLVLQLSTLSGDLLGCAFSVGGVVLCF